MAFAILVTVIDLADCRMVPLIVLLVVLGTVDSKSVWTKSDVCISEDWFSVLETWIGCLTREELVPIELTSDYLNQYCDAKDQLGECMGDMFMGCESSKAVMKDVADTFRICDKDGPMNMYLEAENMTVIVDCIRDHFIPNIVPCMNLTEDTLKPLIGDDPMSYEDGVRYIQRNIRDPLLVCIEPLWLEGRVEVCGNIPGIRLYLGITAALTVEPVPGLDFYKYFLLAFESVAVAPY